MPTPRLVLASGSPRRRELLADAGFEFDVDVSDVDETLAGGEIPDEAASRLALEKAQAVAERRNGRGGREVILAADTMVVVGDRILGKPRDAREAAEMLLSLSGRNHVVVTGWAIVEGGLVPRRSETGLMRSTVRMREIAWREAEAYAAGGEPLDKAGAYAAQGEGRRFIGAIVGPLDNVIGLPVAPVMAALARFGVRPA